MGAFTSHSQAKQDLFVYETVVLPERKHDGLFLDIGANDPVKLSNTYALEQLGWRGMLIDNDPNCCRPLRERRKAQVIEGDATKLNWKLILEGLQVIDYLSLDVDGASQAVLESLPLGRVSFRVATIEHDAYRFGDGPRQTMRKLMQRYGYTLACADVAPAGCTYEDWWVELELLTEATQQWVRRLGGRLPEGW